MAKKRILVLTDNMPWGHRSIAKAIATYLKTQEKTENWQVKYAEIKTSIKIINDVYKMVYRLAPNTNRLSSKLSQYRLVRELIQLTSIQNIHNLRWLIDTNKPDLVISCYFLHSISLAEWRKKEGQSFKLWSVVSDPWSINNIFFSPDIDLHLVYDQVGIRLGLQNALLKSQLLETGWWVEPSMYQTYDRQAVRHKLGFTDERPVIFVGGGSLGNSSLIKILPSLFLVKKPVGIIFNTGNDRLNYKVVAEYAAAFKKLRAENLVQIKNLGWINNMAEILSASDIVFGKAGPNFLFNTVAIGKPFVAITHLGGQEDGNIKLIEEKKLGWVREDVRSLNQFLFDYLDDPPAYQKKYATTIAKEAAHNRRSLEKVANKIRTELK